MQGKGGRINLALVGVLADNDFLTKIEAIDGGYGR